MHSNENSPTRVESLELHIIIHSLKIQSLHSKYQVQVKCRKEIKKETSKMKRNEDTNAIFFESTIDFQLKSPEMNPYGVKFRVYEFIDGLAKKNGKAWIQGSEFTGELIEFRDLYLQGCSDPQGLLCVSISSIKRLLPSVSFNEISIKKNSLEQADSEEIYTGTNESEQGSESKPDLNDLDQDFNTESAHTEPEVKNKIIEERKTPITSKIDAAPNSQSKSRSLEQSERKTGTGPGKNKCCCGVF